MHRAVSMAVSLFLLVIPSAAAAVATKTALRSVFSPPMADPVLACPLGKAPLCKDLAVIGNVVRENRVSADGVCYPVRDGLYADLLPASGRRSPLSVAELGEEIADLWTSRVQTGLFRSPLTAFLYERGWRQGFANAGFPGIDKEFEEVSEFFAPAASGGVVVDMSCGSGLMTRRLVRSGSYARVLALDYSEAMLRETARRVQEEGISTEALTLCRADVAALPLQAASVDAIHAGAAMHCWPRLEEGLRELRAALKPGGRYFATTFFQGAYGVPVREGGGGSFRFFKDEAELKELLVAAGFEEDKVVVRREGTGCAVVRAEA